MKPERHIPKKPFKSWIVSKVVSISVMFGGWLSGERV